MTSGRLPHASHSRRRAPAKPHDRRDYPLQGTVLDRLTADVRAMPQAERLAYMEAVLKALAPEVRKDTMALKERTPFKTEMADLRRLAVRPTDEFLLTDDRTSKRNVLGTGSHGRTHAYWSRQQMWKMATKMGDLRSRVLAREPSLLRGMMAQYRSDKTPFFRDDAFLPSLLKFWQFQHANGTAFPPFHARYLVDQYLPAEGGVVLDPCAGWGGRLLGTLCVPREGAVQYVGVDPNRRNKFAYEGLSRRVTIWLKREIRGVRSAKMFYRPFEEWIRSSSAERYKGRVDLVLTSPPYFGAENYDPDSAKQSGNRYTQYEQWRSRFYAPLMKGAYDLLKRGGVFALNIANVREAPRLEADARRLAREVGFVSHGFYKLAMSIHPGIRTATKRKHHMVCVNGTWFKYEPVFIFRKP
jgi:hypothetical protein